MIVAVRGPDFLIDAAINGALVCAPKLQVATVEHETLNNTERFSQHRD